MKREISEATLNAMRDPIAKLVWQTWIKTGEAVLVPESGRCTA